MEFAKSTSIIIVTYNGMPWIQRCLDSCEGFQVVVVDNNSQDGTVAFIRENYPEVHLISQDKNLGFGQANNLGIRYALDQGSAYVFLLNQDVYLQEGCIKKLLEVQKENPEYGILSPVHFNGSGTQLDNNFLLYLNRYKVNEQLLFDSFKGELEVVYPIEFVNAAAWLISRECLEKVGGFDPLFFHYGEDRNYCQRVLYHGYSSGVVPAATIFHDRESRSEKKTEKYTEAYYKEFERYLKVDWADINLHDFEKKYEERSRYLLSKYRRYLISFQFNKARDAHHKNRLMRNLKVEIAESRKLNMGELPSPHLSP